MKIKSYNNDNYENISLIETFAKVKKYIPDQQKNYIKDTKLFELDNALIVQQKVNDDIDFTDFMKKSEDFKKRSDEIAVELDEIEKIKTDVNNKIMQNNEKIDKLQRQIDLEEGMYNKARIDKNTLLKKNDELIKNLENKTRRLNKKVNKLNKDELEAIEDQFIKVLISDSTKKIDMKVLRSDIEYLKNIEILTPDNMIKYLNTYKLKSNLIKNLRQDINLGLGKLNKNYYDLKKEIFKGLKILSKMLGVVGIVSIIIGGIEIHANRGKTYKDCNDICDCKEEELSCLNEYDLILQLAVKNRKCLPCKKDNDCEKNIYVMIQKYNQCFFVKKILVQN